MLLINNSLVQLSARQKNRKGLFFVCERCIKSHGWSAL